VWLAQEPTGDVGELAAAGLALAVMHGMAATTEPSGAPGRTDGEIVEVGSLVDVDGWYGVYSGVFGAGGERVQSRCWWRSAAWAG
jgi:hypothetical protein